MINPSLLINKIMENSKLPASKRDYPASMVGKDYNPYPAISRFFHRLSKENFYSSHHDEYYVLVSAFLTSTLAQKAASAAGYSISDTREFVKLMHSMAYDCHIDLYKKYPERSYDSTPGKPDPHLIYSVKWQTNMSEFVKSHPSAVVFLDAFADELRVVFQSKPYHLCEDAHINLLSDARIYDGIGVYRAYFTGSFKLEDVDTIRRKPLE